MTTSRLLLAPTLALALLLVGCAAGGPAPEGTATNQYAGGSDGAGSDDAEGSGSQGDSGVGVGAGPIEVDGMPVSGQLHGCDEVVEETVNETAADIQWRWEFVCTSRAAFDASMAALQSNGSLKHATNMVAGNESYISDWHHFIGPFDGATLDVDLKLTGSPDDLELVYLVTLRDAE